MQKHLLQELYRLAVKQQSDGGIRGEDFLALTIGGHEWELRYSTDRGNGNEVEFLFFPRGRRYSRRSLIVYQDGRVERDDRGTVPEFDRLTLEPSLPDDGALLQLGYETLQSRT